MFLSINYRNQTYILRGIMVINISHEDKLRYQESIKPKKIRVRKKRMTKLSDKLKDQAFKQFVDHPKSKLVDEDIQIDEHLKMNDNFLRTGPYKPKKKWNLVHLSWLGIAASLLRSRFFLRF